jgi:glycosyltransferase involved in cell wall biosynthesis
MALAPLLSAPAGAPASVRAQDVSVVICAYTEHRWAALVEAVASVTRQAPAPGETIVVIDHNPELLAQAHTAFPEVTVLANAGRRGLSGARNTGIQVARGDVVAFLDDDASAAPDWLAALSSAFTDATVIGAGGLAVPRWEAADPAWLPAEFLWVVGCSYRGLPAGRAEVRNPIGANMAFRRDALLSAGGFTDGIGRVGRTPLGCEETELSIRARALTGGRVLHLPGCEVHHRVTAERATWRYFRRRCWAEGLSKALVRESVGADAALASERGYVLRTLPTGIWNGIRASTRGDWAGLLRAGAIATGLAITTSGYAWGCVREALNRPA